MHGIYVAPATGEKLKPYVAASGEENPALRRVVDGAARGVFLGTEEIEGAMYALESLRESGVLDGAARAEAAVLLDELQEALDGG